MLAERGAELTLVGRPSPALDEVAEATNAAVALWISRSPKRVTAAVSEILAAGVPDAIVHNAAIIERASVEDTTPDSFARQIAVNLTAPFLLTRALLPTLRARGQGRIVFIGSIASTVGTARAAAYAASKWGLVGFMKSLAEELSGTGLCTLAILPGSVDTEMLAGSGFSPRMAPEDVATTIAWYALDAPPAHNGGVVELFGT